MCQKIVSPRQIQELIGMGILNKEEYFLWLIPIKVFNPFLPQAIYPPPPL
jgi:hypothetical protein